MESLLFKALGYVKGLLYWPRLTDFQLVRVHGRPRFTLHHGTVTIGKRTTIWPGVRFSVVSRVPGAVAAVTIGTACSIGDNTQIHCCGRVSIGDCVLISWGVNILENSYHNTEDGAIRSAPVVIEDRVWIGCNAIVLSGVTIGSGSVVGAGSVVTRDVPPGVLVAGNPAKVIRKTGHWV